MACLFGGFFGAIAGLMLGFAIGVAVVDLFHVSCFEGGCGFMVVFVFAPLGVVAGAVAGSVLAHRFWRRAPPA